MCIKINAIINYEIKTIVDNKEKRKNLKYLNLQRSNDGIVAYPAIESWVQYGR